MRHDNSTSDRRPTIRATFARLCRRTLGPATAIAAFCLLAASDGRAESPRNIVFILVDDQRWDALSCLGHPFLKTPAVDGLAAGGVRFKNAYVTTSLCSPSRASILTGLYAHAHGVVDNQSPMPDRLEFFSERLQRAGYQTAFIGKWHMGHDGDEPRRGWNHWVSFQGQGNYFPELPGGRTAMLNVDGRQVPQRQYITDELTDYALRWLQSHRNASEPWLLFLSHKAVHHNFAPAPRHRGAYADAPIEPFATTKDTPLDALKPMWARNQRNSWHGAEYAFHGGEGSVDDLYRRYCETLLAVDESTGRIVDELRKNGQLESTLVIYTADNGHLWGEQGLIDKRTAYEASIRVPLVMHCPAVLPAGRVVDEIAANIDLAPTILDAAGLPAPDHYHGRSLLPLARGEKVDDWRDALVYEYFWERWAPSTPTLHALVTPHWKFVRAYGLWDVHELYNLQHDPHELRNLYVDPQHRDRALAMDRRLFKLLAATDGETMPLRRGWNGSAKEERSPDQSPWAPFPNSITAPDRTPLEPPGERP